MTYSEVELQKRKRLKTNYIRAEINEYGSAYECLSKENNPKLVIRKIRFFAERLGIDDFETPLIRIKIEENLIDFSHVMLQKLPKKITWDFEGLLPRDLEILSLTISEINSHILETGHSIEIFRESVEDKTNSFPPSYNISEMLTENPLPKKESGVYETKLSVLKDFFDGFPKEFYWVVFNDLDDDKASTEKLRIILENKDLSILSVASNSDVEIDLTYFEKHIYPIIKSEIIELDLPLERSKKLGEAHNQGYLTLRFEGYQSASIFLKGKDGYENLSSYGISKIEKLTNSKFERIGVNNFQNQIVFL